MVSTPNSGISYNYMFGRKTNQEQADANRQYAIAQALLAEGLKPIDTSNRQINGFAYAVSPFEGLAKIAQALGGIYGENKASDAYYNALILPSQREGYVPSEQAAQQAAQQTVQSPPPDESVQGPVPLPPLVGALAGKTQPDPLTQYRQQNGMPTPPVDTQRGSMGLPVGSAIMDGGQAKASPIVQALANPDDEGYGPAPGVQQMLAKMPEAARLAYLQNSQYGEAGARANAELLGKFLGPTDNQKEITNPTDFDTFIQNKIHPDVLAGKTKLAETLNTPYTDANGMPFLYKDVLGKTSSAPITPDIRTGANIASTSLPDPPSFAQFQQPAQPREAAFMPAQPSSPNTNNNLPKEYLASDGKPLVPGVENALKYQPDPAKQPNFIPPNQSGPMGKVQADQIKTQSDAAFKQYSGLDSTLSNLTTQKFYAQKLADVYKDMNSPSAMAEWPQIAQKAYNLGLISDPSSVHDLSGIQRALYLNNQSVLANLKAQSAGMDPDHPMRIFGSEVSANLENAVAPDLTQEARFHNIANTMALIDRNIGSINAYNSKEVGGLGNRLNAGTTMPPTEFMQKYIAAHEPDVKGAEKSMPLFPGMKQQPNTTGQSIDPVKFLSPDKAKRYLELQRMQQGG